MNATIWFTLGIVGWVGFWLATALCLIYRRRFLNEYHDVQMIASYASEVYDTVTGGMVSKPNTLPGVTISVFEEYVDRICEQAIADHLEENDCQCIEGEVDS